MTVDLSARADLREALVGYLRGDLRTFEFDDRNSLYFEQGRTNDQSLREIGRILWMLHDDFIDHPISVSSEGWQLLVRVVTFLETDLELAPAVRRKRLPPFWPFRDEDAWRANKPAEPDPRIPEYDPQIHGRQYRPWWDRIPSVAGFAILLGATGLMILLWSLLARR